MGEDVLGLGYGIVVDTRKVSHFGHNPVLRGRDELIQHCKSSLFLANVPDDGRPFIAGDYSDEPI